MEKVVKKSFLKVLLFVAAFHVFLLAPAVTARAADPSLNTTKIYSYVGGKTKLKLSETNGQKVTWKSSNKKIATVDSKGNVKGKKTGTCTITATCSKKKYKCTVKVLSDKQYLKTWCKTLGKEIKKGTKSPYEQVIIAAMMISGNLKYGKSSSAVDALKKGKGTCVSGNKLLVELLKAMGYSSKIRFAAKDKMSRYPSGIWFGSDHYNVKVTIKKKTYYVDATPGGVVYLSTSKKPLFNALNTGEGWWILQNDLPGQTQTN